MNDNNIAAFASTGKIASRKEIFQFLNGIFFICLLFFAVGFIFRQNYIPALYCLVPMILLIVNIYLIRNTNALNLAQIVFFAILNSIVVYSVFLGQNDSITILIISLSMLVSTLILKPWILAIQIVVFECMQVYLFFIASTNQFNENIISFFQLSGIQFVLVLYGIFIKYRNVQFTFNFLELIDSSNREIIKIPEFLSTIVQKSESPDIQLNVHEDSLHVADPKLVADAFRQFGEKIATLRFDKIVINCYREYVLVLFSTNLPDQKMSEFVNNNRIYDKMTEHYFPDDHYLQKAFRIIHLQMSFSVFPDLISLKITPEPSYKIEKELLRFANYSGAKKVGSNNEDAAWHSKYALGKRELEVIEKILEGKSYKQTAWELGLSVNTIKTYMHRIYKKCNVQSAMELNSLISDSED